MDHMWTGADIWTQSGTKCSVALAIPSLLWLPLRADTLWSMARGCTYQNSRSWTVPVIATGAMVDLPTVPSYYSRWMARCLKHHIHTTISRLFVITIQLMSSRESLRFIIFWILSLPLWMDRWQSTSRRREPLCSMAVASSMVSAGNTTTQSLLSALETKEASSTGSFAIHGVLAGVRPVTLESELMETASLHSTLLLWSLYKLTLTIQY